MGKVMIEQVLKGYGNLITDFAWYMHINILKAYKHVIFILITIYVYVIEPYQVEGAQGEEINT